jgi:hypothetical protein
MGRPRLHRAGQLRQRSEGEGDRADQDALGGRLRAHLRNATSVQTPSTRPNGHAPCMKP